MGKRFGSVKGTEGSQRKEKKIRLSVLIPVCNTAKYLRKCLESVVNQTLRTLEIICVNDGSTDRSLEILQEFAAKDSRIRIIDKPNTGYGNSMNIALDAATGDYIGIVESDDFIALNMYESLCRLSNGGTVDLVKGNFYNYYVEDGKVRKEPDHDRDMIPDSETPFTLRQDAQISWGHPSIWSAIYRREMLEKHHIRFLEAKGGGWVDNPFFYETLCKAESIVWTREPFYYYLRTNLNSSSNLQKDPTIPLTRMMQNLDVLGKNDCFDAANKRCAYARAFMYLNGAVQDFDYDRDRDVIDAQAETLMRRLDEHVMLSDFNSHDQFLYYSYLSPLKRMREKGPKILIYNWLPFDNPWRWGGGVTVYCRNLIEEILLRNPEATVYFLSSGFAYMATKTEIFYRKIGNPFGDAVRQYEIVNSPVPADQKSLYVNPCAAIENPALKAVFQDFLESYGPFDVVHFQNIEGLSLDVLDLKKQFPHTKWIYSMHNYVPLCVTGFYYMRHQHCNCHPERSGSDCFACTRADIRRSLAMETYQRGQYGQDPQKCVSAKRWIRALELERLDVDVSPERIQDFARAATAKLNENCDHILTVSRRVYEIAVENGFDEKKLSVSYIGTKVAENQSGRASAEPPEKSDGRLKIVFLGSDIDYEEKGYPFLLDALEGLEERYAARIDLLLTVKQAEHAEMETMLRNFYSLRIVQGYTHDDLPWIFEGAHLSLVPVLWEDNLPQIAIESAAYGVPVLTSDAGGAKELCDSPLFTFKCADAEDLRRKIAWFVDHPEDLAQYWSHHKGLVTMEQHWKELRALYNLPERKDNIVMTPEDFRYLLKEHEFLRRNLSFQQENFTPASDVEALRRELSEAREEKERLQAQIDQLEGFAMIAESKLIFQNEPEALPDSTGAYLFKIVLDDFMFSDFYAEIHFVKVSNLNASPWDILHISGTILEDREGGQSLRLHQTEWERGGTPLTNAIRVLVKGHEVWFFATHPEIASGYLWQVAALTSRALHNSVKVEVMHEGFFFEHELTPEDAVTGREPVKDIPEESTAKDIPEESEETIL